MRLFVVLLAAFLAFVGITGYGGNEMGRYEKISPEEAKLMMGHEHVLVVDVRRPEEYKEGTTWPNRRKKKKDQVIGLDGMEAVGKIRASGRMMGTEACF